MHTIERCSNSNFQLWEVSAAWQLQHVVSEDPEKYAHYMIGEAIPMYNLWQSVCKSVSYQLNVYCTSVLVS